MLSLCLSCLRLSMSLRLHSESNATRLLRARLLSRAGFLYAQPVELELQLLLLCEARHSAARRGVVARRRAAGVSRAQQQLRLRLRVALSARAWSAESTMVLPSCCGQHWLQDRLRVRLREGVQNTRLHELVDLLLPCGCVCILEETGISVSILRRK